MISQRLLLCSALVFPCYVDTDTGMCKSSKRGSLINTSENSEELSNSKPQHFKEAMHSPVFHYDATETELHVPLPHPVTLFVVF